MVEREVELENSEIKIFGNVLLVQEVIICCVHSCMIFMTSLKPTIIIVILKPLKF